tara:strand:- start:3098 stop:4288 length:1191 start_codon:yes stop_codon:yes gene_type:complete
MGRHTSVKDNKRLNFKKKNFKYFFPLLLIGVYFLSFSFSHSIEAQQPTPTPTPTPIPQNNLPPVKIYDALGYQGISFKSNDDFLVLVRYELPIGESPSSFWCQSEFLENSSGCEESIPNPDFPFSLRDGYITAIFYDNADVLHMVQPKVPRIGNGLLGIYADAPAGTDFGFNSSLMPSKVCLVLSDSYFIPYPNSNNYNCVRVRNENNGTISLANQVSSDSGILYDLETEIGLPLNTLVSANGKVTPSGQVYLEEALSGIVTVARNAQNETVFQLGVNRPNQTFDPTGYNVPLQASIDAEIENSKISSNLNIISGQYLGFDNGAITGGLIFLILALIIAVVTMVTTKNGVMALVMFAVTMLPAIFIGGLSVAFLFTFLSIFIVLGSWFWIRKAGAS